MPHLRNIARFLFIATFGLSVFCADAAKQFLDACAENKPQEVRRLLYACKGNEACINELLTATDNQGRGPLHLVIKPSIGKKNTEIEKSIEIFHTLASFGANPNAIMHGGFSALHLAVMFGTPDIIKYLLEVFGNIYLNIEDGESNVALHYVGTENLYEILKLFFDSGKDIGLITENKDGRRAFDQIFDLIITHYKGEEKRRFFNLLSKHGYAHTKVNGTTISKIVLKKVNDYCSLALTCYPDQCPTDLGPEAKRFGAKTLKNRIITSTNNRNVPLQERMLDSIRVFENAAVKQFLSPISMHPNTLKSMVTEALESNNIDIFSYLVRNNTNLFYQLLDIDKCSKAALIDLINTYEVAYFSITNIKPNHNINFLLTIFKKVWENGDPSKFAVLLNHNILNKYTITYQNTEGYLDHIVNPFVDLLVEQIKLDDEGKGHGILRMVFNNISPELKKQILSQLSLTYLVRYKFYDFLIPQITDENINKADDKGRMLLHMAIIYNDDLLLDHLLNKEFDLHIYFDELLLKSFSTAIKNGNTKALDKLTDWLKSNNNSLENFVSMATQYALPEVMSYLFIKNDLDPNRQINDKGHTILHMAIIYNDSLLLNYLLNKGVGSYIYFDNLLLQSFSTALQNGTTEALDELMNWLQANNRTPLENALSLAAYCKLPKVVSYFLFKNNFDPNKKDENGNTFIHFALEQKMPGLLKILKDLQKLEWPVDYNIANNQGRTLLDSASMSKDKRRIKFFENLTDPTSSNNKRKAKGNIDDTKIKRQKTNMYYIAVDPQENDGYEFGLDEVDNKPVYYNNQHTTETFDADSSNDELVIDTKF